MTTEDDFQRKLDENRRDWQTRLVFADWLEDRGDPRADGYRALGQLRIYPQHSQLRSDYWFTDCRVLPKPWKLPEALPADWHGWLSLALGGSEHGQTPPNHNKKTRREVEDAAALAFAKLPAPRRALYLNFKTGSRRLYRKCSS